jgi:hypothetical protein
MGLCVYVGLKDYYFSLCFVRAQKSAAVSSNVNLCDELSSDDVDEAMRMLRALKGDGIGGLQDSILGVCKRSVSLPKFSPCVNERFVQIFNTGDHWVCATNTFSDAASKVYVYDSLYTKISQSLVVQVSSLLRCDDDPDEIEFYVRDFQQQRMGTRLCGYYAVAACVACVLGDDPTGMIYDENMLQPYYEDLIGNGNVQLFPGTRSTTRKPLNVHPQQKLHCLCQRTSAASREMIQCSNCLYWFHCDTCVSKPQTTPTTLQKQTWFCSRQCEHNRRRRK